MSAGIPSTEFGFLSPTSMKSDEGCKDLFRIMASTIPEIIPQKYDTEEPIRRKFDMKQFDEIAGLWGDGFFWTRNSPKVVGQYWSGTDFGYYDGVYISIDSSDFDGSRLFPFLEEVTSRFDVIIGYIHRVYDGELSDLDYYKNCVMPFTQGLTIHDLKNGIPGLCWVTYFGKPYLEKFGDQIQTVQTAKVLEYRNGVCLQLTDDIFSPDVDYESFKANRDSVIQHLGNSVFVQFEQAGSG